MQPLRFQHSLLQGDIYWHVLLLLCRKKNPATISCSEARSGKRQQMAQSKRALILTQAPIPHSRCAEPGGTAPAHVPVPQPCSPSAAPAVSPVPFCVSLFYPREINSNSFKKMAITKVFWEKKKNRQETRGLASWVQCDGDHFIFL